MAVAFQVGDRVRVTVPWLTGCKPGDTGTITLVAPISGGGVMYHVQMDAPCRAGMVIRYPNEVEPAPGT
jgi:hypothetical protein